MRASPTAPAARSPVTPVTPANAGAPRPPGPRVPTRRYALLIPVFGLLLVVGASAVLWYLYDEIRQQNRQVAIDDAGNFARSVIQFRNYYSAEIVPRVKAAGIPLTHAYRDTPGTLPLPATFTLDFGNFLSESDGFAVSLYSAYPFPWRAGERRLDAFQRDALAALQADPGQAFHRVDSIGGVPVLRYAIADRMVHSCVSCHNSYPRSPKTDWQVGDVRGVLEVRRPMAQREAGLDAGMRNAAMMSIGVIGSAMMLVWLAMRSLNAATRRSRLLAGETAAANEQLQAEISRREGVEETLRFNEGKLRGIFDGILEGVIVIDREGRIIEANRVVTEMFGWPMHELIGANVSMLMPAAHASAHDGYIRNFLATGERRVIGRMRHVDARRCDGTLFPIRLAVSEVRLGDAVYFTGVVADVSAQVARERELRAARDAALDSARLKSEFLANMSHEIRTPMNGVIGMTELVLDTELDADQREMLQTVRQSADALLRIINDILDFSKIEAGKMTLSATDFDPVETIESTIDLLTDRADTKGLALAYRIEGAVPRWVHADEGRLRQVLTNLLGNAVKFTERGRVQVSLSAVPGSEDVRVTVSDTGVGMAPEKLRYLFQPFSQLDGSTTRRFGGTGLGLAISRQLVELMGGQITVSTVAGEGSTFAFTIRVGSPRGPRPAPDPVERLRGARVVIAGESPLLAEQLAGWGIDVVEASDCDALRARLDDRPTSLVLVDGCVEAAAAPDADVRRDAALDARLESLVRTARLTPVAVLHRRRVRLVLPPSMPQVLRLVKPLRARTLADALASAAATVPIDAVSRTVRTVRTSAADTRTGIAPGAAVAPAASDDARRRGADQPEGRLENAAATRDAADRAPSPTMNAADPPFAGRRVLVVEDNPVNQAVMQRLLGKLGIAVELADNGELALVAMARGGWDLVLMDCQMPVLDGFEATRRWRARETPGQARQTIIALTANAMAGDRERCLEAGMDDYLSKPVGRDALAGKLAAWLVTA